MSKKITITALIGSLVVMAAILWWWQGKGPHSGEQNKSDGTPLRISADLWVGYGPISLAKEKNLFAAEGLDARLNVFTEMGDSIKAFENGNVDISLLTLYEVLLLKDRGVDAVVVMLIDYSNGADSLVAKKGLALGDLRGKTIAVEVGTISHFTLLHALKAGGLNEADVTLLNLGGTDMPDAFKNNKVDAAASWEPFSSKMVAEGNGQVVFSSKEMPGKIVDVMVVHRAVLQQRKDDVVKLCRSWFKALDYLEKNRKESEEILGKVQGSGAADYGSQLEGVHLGTIEDNKKAFGVDSEASIMVPFNEMLKFMEEHKLLKTKHDPLQLIDSSVIKAAL